MLLLNYTIVTLDYKIYFYLKTATRLSISIIYLLIYCNNSLATYPKDLLNLWNVLDNLNPEVIIIPPVLFIFLSRRF